MANNKQDKVIVITGSSRGIGRFLSEYFLDAGWQVVGCSRKNSELKNDLYKHYSLDITDEKSVKAMFSELRKNYKGVDILINNAGIAAMNHTLLTPMESVNKVLSTNIGGTFLFCREAAKIMQGRSNPRIVNFTTVAVPLKLEGEAIYAASKAAVITLTEILARELANFKITVNAIGPTPTDTDLIKGVPKEKINALIDRQAIKRFGTFNDVLNVINFFIRKESDFVTGQTIFLGGV